MVVLVITSRRAKVNELLADKEADYSARVGKWGNMTQDLYDADDWDRFKDNIRIIKDEWGEHPFYQKSVACTNAFIEKYIQNVYDPSDPGTHLWNLFDMIVVDEYHSLVVDASFQTALSTSTACSGKSHTAINWQTSRNRQQLTSLPCLTHALCAII